jgi:hypothetical protein
VRDDAGHGHRHGLVDVDPRPAVFEDRGDELVGQRPVGAAVTARGHPRRQRRTRQVGQVLHHALVFRFIHPALLAEDPSGLDDGSVYALAHEHPGRAALAGLEQGDLVAERVVVAVGPRREGGKPRVEAQARDGRIPLAGDADVIGGRVRGIPQGRHPGPPLLERGDRRRAEVVILALGVDEPAEPAGVIDLPHGVAVLAVTTRLGHHVLQAGLLHRLHELSGLFEHPPHRGHRGHRMLAVVEHFDAVLRVVGGVGRYEDRLDCPVLDQLLQRVIGLVAAAGLHQAVSPLGDQVADRDDLDVRMVLEAEVGAEPAHAVTDDPDADLAVGDRLPRLARRPLPRAGLTHRQRAAGHRPQRDDPQLLQKLPPNHRMHCVVAHKPASFIPPCQDSPATATPRAPSISWSALYRSGAFGANRRPARCLDARVFTLQT